MWSLNLEGRRGIADVRAEDFDLIVTRGGHSDGAFCIEMVPQQLLYLAFRRGLEFAEIGDLRDRVDAV